MIFISHSSRDHDAAAALHARLLDRGYDPSQLFLDSDKGSGIAAGEQWQQVLYARLKDCRALIVLCTQNWLDSKWCFAELIYAKASGKEIFPVILEPCDFRGVLDEHQAVLVHRDGDAAWERLWRALDTRHLGPRDDFGWPPKDGDACPFPGLLSFDERYAGVYFGREPETQAVLEELRKMRAHGEPRLLMITGGSGSGKSSLLKAGVLPQLTHKSSGTEWLVLPVLRYGQAASPQHTVFDQLAMNVAPSDWKTLRDTLAGPEAARAFVDATRDLAVARGSAGATVLLPVDQFEELLAPAAGPDAGAFLRFLHEVFGCANGRLLAIGTMRSDHLDIYERHPHALTAPYFQPWRLGPFPRDRVRDVIVKPAGRAGVEVTPDLLARLERDTPSSESLPLLAFTLEKLYRRYAADRKLELQEYEDLGGMEGAIQKSADAIAVAPDVLGAVRLTFVKHLASFNDKDEAVRVTARWSDIPDTAKPALEKFVADRLLVKNDHDDEGGRWVSVEVAHEALFRAWPALKQWLDDAADILRWRRDVQRDRAADPQWRALRPSQLAVARPWLRHRRNELTDAEVGWIRNSIRRERVQWAFAVAVAALILGFGIYAFVQKRAAERESQVALGRYLASQSVEVVNTSPSNVQQALLLAIEGYRRDPAAVTAAPLRAVMATTPLPVSRLQHDGGVDAVAFSPDGRWLATGDEKGNMRVWDLRTKTQVAAIRRGHRIGALFWRPDGQQLAAVLEAPPTEERDGPVELVLWNWHSKDAPAIVIPPRASRVLATRNPERWLLSIAPGALQVWGMGAPRSVPTGLDSHAPVAITAAGNLVAVTTGDGKAQRVHVLDTGLGREVAAPHVVGDFAVMNLSFRTDGEVLAVGTRDRSTRVWDWRRKAIQSTHRSPLHSGFVSFSPDGKLVAEGGWHLFRIWDSSSARDVFELESDPSPFEVRWARFTNDGKRLISAVGDGTLRVFSIDADAPVLAELLFTAEAPVWAADVDATGTFAAVGSADGWVTVWRLAAGGFVHEFPAEAAIEAPRGSAVALLGSHARIVDVQSWRTLLPLGEVGPLAAAVFSADGEWFAWNSDANRIVVANLRTRSIRSLSRAEVADMRFSADGTQLIVVGRGLLQSIDVVSGARRTLIRQKPWSRAVLSPGARFFAASAAGRIHVYDVTTAKEVASIASDPMLLGFRFSADGTVLAHYPTPETLSLWSTESHTEVLRIPVGNPLAVALAFDAAGHHVAISDNAAVHIYDMRTKKRVRTLVQGGGQIVAMVFSPDGAYLTVGCADKQVRIWRLADGKGVMTIPQESSFIGGGAVAFTPDGKYLMVTQFCGACPTGMAARFVLWRPDDVVREACRRSMRTALTPAEWQQFLPGQPYRETCGAAELHAAFD